MSGAAGATSGSTAGQGAQPQAGGNTDTPTTPTTPVGAPQAGATDPVTPTAGDPTQADPNESISLEKARELRRENAAKTARLKELEAWKTEREQADMTELQKAQAAQTAAEAKATKAQEALVQRDLQDAARKLGIVDPEVAAMLVKEKLDYDEAGRPVNAEALFRQLLKDKPHFANTANVNGSPANPPRGGANAGQQVFTHAQLEDLDFYAKNNAAIKQAMREGRIVG